MQEFCDVYSEIAKMIGEENTIKLYRYFRGQSVNFPMRLYSVEYVEDYVRKHYDGSNIKFLANKFNYSERRVRQFLKEESFPVDENNDAEKEASDTEAI